MANVSSEKNNAINSWDLLLGSSRQIRVNSGLVRFLLFSNQAKIDDLNRTYFFLTLKIVYVDMASED